MIRALGVVALVAALAGGQAESGPATRVLPSPQGAAEAVLGPSVTKRESALKWVVEHPETHDAVAQRLRAMGPDIHFDGVRALGRVRTPSVTAALREVAAAPTFAWKPMALEALADHADAESRALFAEALASPVARSRAAGVRGLAAIGAFIPSEATARLGADDEAAVRLEYARALFASNPAEAIRIACRDLTLDRKFGDFDPGRQARLAASDWIRTFGVAVPSPDRAIDGEAATKIARDVMNVRGLSEGSPPTVVAHPPDVVAPTTLVEVRSCIEGDLFLRIDGDGRVVAGRDALTTLRIDPEIASGLVTAVGALDLGAKGRRILGPVNCDFIRVARGGPTAGSLLVGTGRGDAAVLRVHAATLNVVRAALGPDAEAAHTRRAAPFLPKS